MGSLRTLNTAEIMHFSTSQRSLSRSGLVRVSYFDDGRQDQTPVEIERNFESDTHKRHPVPMVEWIPEQQKSYQESS